MTNARIELEIPIADEAVCCPLCGASDGQVVGKQGRFGMPVRNICCADCAMVYVTPRPSESAMAEYYRSTYRKHYGGVGYIAPDGSRVGPGEPGFDDLLRSWHKNQAQVALALAKTAPGSRVLEVGCRHAMTLRLMREACGIDAYGIEPGEAEAAEACSAGVKCFTGNLEEYNPGELRFDQIQLFHVLEHLHEPLESIVRLRSWLKPGGALLVEVPNAYQPYGPLEENFFQNVHLATYSANTLPAMFKRAGLSVELINDGASLHVFGRRIETTEALPLPYDAAMLTHAEEDCNWVATRLRSYANLEKLVFALNHNGYSPALFAPLIQTLKWPAFTEHMINVCATFTEKFATEGLLREALMLASAVAVGPFPEDVCNQFRALAEQMNGGPLSTAEQTTELSLAG